LRPFTKGREYFAGVLLIPVDFMSRDNGPANIMRMNTLFVSMTRIRDEMIVVYLAASSIVPYLPLN